MNPSMKDDARPTLRFIVPANDPWHLASGEDGPRPQPAPQDHALLTLEQWHAVRAHWPAALRVGVSVPNDVDVLSLRDDLARLTLVVLNFPKWTDGRAYSQARMLRARMRYAGEVRAAGEVLVDMVPLIARTGFSSAQLRGDQDVGVARSVLHDFSAHYQGLVSPTVMPVPTVDPSLSTSTQH